MIGDGDGSIEGVKVISKEMWQKEETAFKHHLSVNDISDVVHDSKWGCYNVNLDNYRTKPITAEEAKTLNKFIGSSQGDFRLPSEFLS